MHFAVPSVTALLWLFFYFASSEDFYCSQDSVTVISGETEGRIITRYEGKSHYEDNQVCEWQVVAEPGRRIQITVEQSELQYSQKIANCEGYDHVAIKEEKNNLISWCGHQHPDNVNTRGNLMTVKFMSDSTSPFRQQYKGVELKFKIFDASQCPPFWLQSGEACFKYKPEQENWIDAQTVCNNEQANLASIATEEEYNFIHGRFSDKMWIGLNDRSRPGTFTWIDGASTSAFFSNIAKPSPHEFKHCVIMDDDKNKLYAHDCERAQFSFLCKTGKGYPSTLHGIPQAGTNKGDDDPSGRILLLGLLIPAAVVLVLIVVGICIWRKRNKLCRRKDSTKKRYETSAEDGNRAELAPVQPSAPTTDEIYRNDAPLSPPPFVPSLGQHVAPPSYEQSLNDPVLPTI